jgi:predicted nucleic acid-binding Zn ribbon protein
MRGSRSRRAGDADDVRLGDALQAYLSGQGLHDTGRLGEIVRCWSDVVGRDVANHVVPWRIDGDELVLAVDDPAWATEVGFLAAPILADLATRLGRPVLQRVKVHVKLSFGVD